MTIIVQKFGGTSLGNIDRLQAAADRVIATRAEGHDVVVVVSAMGGETDRFINLAHQLQSQPAPREYAMLLSTGEQASAALLAMALQAKDQAAKSYAASQVRILTDASHQKARILGIETEVIQSDLAEGRVVIVAGFQGVNEVGEITTLGRGGSDATAVALAAVLKAAECQIFTDVEGVYTADPRVIPEARLIESISFSEMMALSSLGAKVVQARAVELAAKHDIPVRVLSSLQAGKGTLIHCAEQRLGQPAITGITSHAKVLWITLQSERQDLMSCLQALTAEKIAVDLIQSAVSKNRLSFSIIAADRSKLDAVLKLFENINIDVQSDLAKVSLIGIGLQGNGEVLAILLSSLGQADVNVHQLSVSERDISCLLPKQQLQCAMSTLHTTFGLGEG